MLSYLTMSRPAPTTDIRHKPGPCEVGVSPPASFTPYAATGFPHFLTCIVVEHSGHVFLWEGIIGVAHEQAGFPHRTVPHHHTLQHLLLLAVTAAAAAVISFLAVHSCRSSCCDCADAVASPASPKAHEAVGSQWQAWDHFALLWVPGIILTCPRKLACTLLLTILVKKGNTLGRIIKRVCPFSLSVWVKKPSSSPNSRGFLAVWKLQQPEGFTPLSPSPAWLKTRWNIAESSPFSTSHLTWRKAGLFNGVFPLLPSACECQEIMGFLLHSILGSVGWGRLQQWELCVCVFVLLGNAARTWSGKTLGVPLQTQAVRLPVSSTAGEAVCLWLAGKGLTKGWKLGSTVCHRNGNGLSEQREPHQPL